MDALDRKILAELLKNSRTPVARIGRLVGASRERVTYRIDRLVDSGIIQGFVTLIDERAFGLSRFVMFADGPVSLPGLAWSGTLLGRWRWTADILAAETPVLADGVVLRVASSGYFFEKLLGLPAGRPRPLSDMELDGIDRRILRMLNADSRASYADLGVSLGLSGNAIKKRIKALEASGVIQRYTVSLDHAALGLDWYGVQVRGAVDEGLLREHANVFFYYVYADGPFDADFGLLARDVSEARQVLDEILQRMPVKVLQVFSVVSEESTLALPEHLIDSES